MTYSASTLPKLPVGGDRCARSTLSPGVGLARKEYLCSRSNGYTFIMEKDGDLVEYNSQGQALWANRTYGIDAGSSYGVPQADPRSKVRSVAPNCATDSFTQATLKMEYIHSADGDLEGAFATTAAGCVNGSDFNGYTVKEIPQ